MTAPVVTEISFTPEGGIRVEGEGFVDFIYRGDVLLTKEQAEASKQHGWEPYFDAPYGVDANDGAPLYLVSKP